MISINVTNSLIKSLKLQQLPTDISKIAVNIYTKQSVFSTCFIEYETPSVLGIVETMIDGSEQIRIVPKENLDYIEVVYEQKDEKPKRVVMYQ